MEYKLPDYHKDHIPWSTAARALLKQVEDTKVRLWIRHRVADRWGGWCSYDLPIMRALSVLEEYDRHTCGVVMTTDATTHPDDLEIGPNCGAWYALTAEEATKAMRERTAYAEARAAGAD